MTTACVPLRRCATNLLDWYCNDNDDDEDGLSRRHDLSLVDEDEFAGVSRNQSEKHRCGHT